VPHLARWPRIVGLLLSSAATLVAGFATPTSVSAQESDAPEVEEVVIQATRSGRLVQDEPIRVEVVNREEIEEKIIMRPGNIALLLSETGGLRVQVTSPALGAANVRVQGMRGRYTQLLTDGLPLYGGQAIGLLQIPPTDLGRVEIIKGAASALYGPAALGGVINLVSRRPSDTPLGEILLNATSRDGQDATGYVSGPLTNAWSYSMTVGGHRQGQRDLDSDGWVDMPGYERWTARPRLFWTGPGGASIFLTAGAMGEQRWGGTLPGRTTPDGSAFAQGQNTRRFDVGGAVQLPLTETAAIHLRAAGLTQSHDHRFGSLVEEDRHYTVFAEASIAGGSDETSWVAGLAWNRDGYRSRTFPAFDYTHDAPAAFAQVDHDLRPGLTLAASGRWDAHDTYGSRFSPRLSALYRPGPWTLRASIGSGFYAPTPFVEEIEAAGLGRLEPLMGLKAETAESGSLETGYRSGPLEASLLLFATHIHDAVQITAAERDRVRLVNAEGTTRTAGAEALLRYRWHELTLTGTYVFVEASEPDAMAGARRAIPLTPSHTAGLVAMWERHDWGRIGFEAYYTGRQQLDDNPYRIRSKDYFELGVLVERRFGPVSVFVNLENLLDVRQTKHDPLVLPRRVRDGRWTVDAWAPTEGFVASGGVRVRFGGG
jgi:outer membrane receptor for ferrienterochelin and colicins